MTKKEWVKKIKIACIERDMTLTKLCAEIGYTYPWVMAVMHDRAKAPNVEERISEFLGIEMPEK